MSRPSILQDIELLVGLGAPSRITMSLVAKHIRRLLPDAAIGYYFFDEQGAVKDALIERTSEALMARLCLVPELASESRRLRYYLATGGESAELTRLLTKRGSEEGELHTPFRTSDGERGVLALMPLARRNEWSSGDQLTIRRIASALGKIVRSVEPCRGDGRVVMEGMVLMGDLAPQAWTAAGRRLIAMVGDPKRLDGLVSKTRIAEETPTGPSPQTLTLDTVWGRFECRAYRLAEPNPRRPSTVIIRVSLWVPAFLDCIDALSDTRFTPKETLVVIQFLGGSSKEDIARALGMSVHTVVTHIRRVYGKANVRSRDELRQFVQRLCRPRERVVGQEMEF